MIPVSDVVQAAVDERAVSRLIMEREDARRSRDYRTADALRDNLSREFSVTVDDEERQWWVGERKVCSRVESSSPCP